MERFNKRTKVISIRLSDEEYEQLQNLCVVKGADSISDLTRAAMKLLMMPENGSGKVDIEARVNAMHLRVTILDREVARLSDLIGIARLEHVHSEGPIQEAG